MAGRMAPSTSVGNHPVAAAAAAPSDAAKNYARLKEWIERECTECDAAINEHRKQIDDYRNQKGRLEELQKKISHPIMVPFGSVGFMPGKLVRTNEVMVLLGANYFSECSVHDTGKIIDRRIRDINSIVEKLEHQKRNARERLNFAQGLFGGAMGGEGEKDEPIEIREEYDEKKEAELRRVRAQRAAAARAARAAEKKVPQPAFENMMSRLDELEKEEKKEARRVMVEELDSDDELPEEEKEVKAEPKKPMVQMLGSEIAVKAEPRKPMVQVLDSDSKVPPATNVVKTETKKPMVQVLDSDDEMPEEEEEYVERPMPPEPPKGVNPEEYKRLLARLDQLDTDETSDEDEEEELDSDDAIEEGDEEMDSDDLSDGEEQKRAKFDAMRRQMEANEHRMMREREEEEKRAVHPRRLIEVIEDSNDTAAAKKQPQPTVPSTTPTVAQSITEQIPAMTVVSESDRVVDLVEYQNQQEEDDKAKENSPSRKLTHKRSVRFKKNLEAGPCEKSIDSDDVLVSPLDSQVNPRSILRNKSEESPIDKLAFSEMEDQRTTTILPAGDAFSGCVVERQASAELPIVFKPVDEPPRRVSRFKLQRMQQATE